jgi:hypothetical protein
VLRVPAVHGHGRCCNECAGGHWLCACGGARVTRLSEPCRGQGEELVPGCGVRVGSGVVELIEMC